MKSSDDYIMTFTKEAYRKLMEAYGFEKLSLEEIIVFAQSVVTNVSREDLDEEVIDDETDPELQAEIFTDSFVATWKNILESDIRVSVEEAAKLLIGRWSKVTV